MWLLLLLCQVCQQLRDTYDTSALPVIMVSAKNREKEIVRGLQVRFMFEAKVVTATMKTSIRLHLACRHAMYVCMHVRMYEYQHDE